MKSWNRAVILAVVVFVLAATAALAMAPNVRKAGGTTGVPVPVVDGNQSEWQTTPLTSTNPDWFSYMCTGSGGGGISCSSDKIHGDLFLRYDCGHSVLIGLALADRGFAYAPGSTNNFVKNGTTILVNDGVPFTTNTSAPMWRDLTDGTGAEFALNTYDGTHPWVPGTTYSINFHTEMAATSGTNDTNVTIPVCSATAVTVSSMSAENTDNGVNFALLTLSGAGLVVLGGLVFFAARKR